MEDTWYKWLDPVIVIFFKNAKRITSVGWSSRCKFFWNAPDPTLENFFGNEKKFDFQKIFRFRELTI